MTGNASKLKAITKSLLVQWQQTREDWRDDKSLEFDLKYIQELLAGVERAVAVIDELDKLIVKIRRDCE